MMRAPRRSRFVMCCSESDRLTRYRGSIRYNAAIQEGQHDPADFDSSVSRSSASASAAHRSTSFSLRRAQGVATPVAGLNVRPGYFPSSEYYRAPIDNLRTYPVYHPDRESAGYGEALRKKHPEPLIELNKPRTKSEWIAAGKRVWEELDVPIFRLFDAESIALARSRDHFKDSKPYVQADGTIFGYRWVVTSEFIALTLSECSACHVHHMDDGTAIGGPGFNHPFGDSLFPEC
jgi:hypothetical protein